VALQKQARNQRKKADMGVGTEPGGLTLEEFGVVQAALRRCGQPALADQIHQGMKSYAPCWKAEEALDSSGEHQARDLVRKLLGWA
jgi:hypothetical protein